MGAPCNPYRQHSSLLVLLLLFGSWGFAYGQVALRTLPLTASRNKSSSGLGIFSKWGGTGPSISSLNSDPSIENELAAIFRGVAYGVTTEPPSTTTTSTTTTSTTIKPVFTSKVPVFRVVTNSENSLGRKHGWQEESDARPVVKSPVVEQEDNEKDMIPYDSSTEESVPKVVKADIGISDIAWVASLGIPWQIHVYVTAGLFSLLALLSLYCLARVHMGSQLLPKGYYITVHLLVFLAAFFRCVFFFHDPYSVSHRLPTGLANLLFNTGTPCIITALAVLVLALLRAARLKLLPLNLQSPIAVAIISGVLVVGSVMVDILEGIIPEQQLASGLRAGIQALTAGWGSALCIGYIFIFSKIDRSANRQQIELLRLSFSRIHLEGSSIPQHVPKSSLSHGARVTLIACITGLLLALLQVYGLMNSDGITSIPPFYPWVWFAFQSSCRFLELLMWTCVCIASALPANYAKTHRHQTGADDSHLLTVFACNGGCVSCSNVSSCCYSEQKLTDDMYSTICQSNHVARNYGHEEKCIIPQDTIASTRMNPKNVSTTLLPQKPKSSQRNTSTLHSGGSDVHLLWNNTKSNSNSPNSSSRPSSLILTEGGLIKFRTHDPRSNNVKIFSFPKHDSSQEVRNKIMQSCNGSGEDNYINSGALTPEEKRVFEHSIRSGNVPILLENKIGQPNYPQSLQKTNSFKSEGDIKGKYYAFNPNNYDLHVYEDGDQVCYQSPSLDSSMDSNGHLYASVAQPPYQRRTNTQTPSRNPQEKILNNSNSFFSSQFSPKTTLSSPQHETNQIDYLTDASQEYMSPQKEDTKTFLKTSYSPNHEKLSVTTSSPSHVYKCYVPKTISDEHSILIGNYATPEGSVHMNDHLNGTDGYPISPQGRGSVFSQIVSSQSGNVYSPLRTDDICFTLAGDRTPKEQSWKGSHRPRHAQLSPLHMQGPNLFLNSPKSSPRQMTHQATRRGEDSPQRRILLSPHREKIRERQEIKESDQNRHQDSYEAHQSHNFLLDRVASSWADENKTQSLNSSEATSMNGSYTDLHSESVDTDESENLGRNPRDINDIRWPARPQNNKVLN